MRCGEFLKCGRRLRAGLRSGPLIYEMARETPEAETNRDDHPQHIQAGGDVVGGDKITAGDDYAGRDLVKVDRGGVHVAEGGQLRQTIVDLPRAVQIGIGVAVLAIVALAVVLIASRPGPATVNTHFVFDASEAMADPERFQIAQSVLGDQALFATRREQLGLRIARGCQVSPEPEVSIGAERSSQIVEVVDGLQPGGDAAIVESIKAAADDLPPDPELQNVNTIIVISAGQDTCLTKRQRDPCQAMSAVAQSLERSKIEFTLHIIALKPGEQARQELTCLARASVNGFFYEANSSRELRSILQQIEPGEDLPGVRNGSFESGDASSWGGEGIQVVTVEDADAPAVGKYAAQLAPGGSITQTARVPDIEQPQLSVWYRAPGDAAGGTLNIYVEDRLEFSDDRPAEYAGKLIAAQAPDWLVAVIDAQPFAGQTVTLRIEYVEAAARAGGILRHRASQAGDRLWIDNVAILTQSAVSSLTQPASLPAPAQTVTPEPAATRTPTSRPDATIRPADTATPLPSATHTRTPTPLPISFTWRTGASRQSGVNEQGAGIWAQEVFVTPSGGVPPYTIVFEGGGQQWAGPSFEVFGLLCIGQVGSITVRSADGQQARQPITIPAPLCPTRTPVLTPPIPSAPEPISPAAEENFPPPYPNPCTDIEFRWNPVATPGVTYEVQVVRDLDGSVAASASDIAGTSITFNLCADGYNWRVRAVRSSDGEPGTWSFWTLFSVD